MIKKLYFRLLSGLLALLGSFQNALAQSPVPPPNLTNPIKSEYGSLIELITVGIPRFLITYLVGPLTILFFMINAVTLLFSAPTPDQAAKAKTGMLWSVIGFVLAISSLAIVRFIEGVIKG